MKVYTPVLDAVELTVSFEDRKEALSENEFLLLEQLMRFREQPLNRDSLLGTVFRDESDVPDRVVDKMLARLIAKTNVLFPTFPLVRRIDRDTWVYTEVPPKKKVRA